MITFPKKSIVILLGIVFFAGGASVAGAATIDTLSGGGGIPLDTPTAPGFSFPTAGGPSGGEPDKPTNLGGAVAAPAPSFGSQVVNPDPAVTAAMANATAATPQASTAIAQASANVAVAQAAYDQATLAVQTAAGGPQQQAAASTLASTFTTLQAAKAALATASGGPTATQNTDGTDDTEDAILAAQRAACSFTDMTQCVLLVPIYLTYYLVYKPAAILLTVAGLIFDYTLSLSIDREFINQPFVASSWTIIRDFSNMAFIFILLYTGISTMLGMGNWRKTVIQVVIIALLINFSLFFTKVVIDAGNILAVSIYSSMGAVPAVGQKGDLSKGLVGAVQPQEFIKKAAVVGPINSIMIFVVAAIVNIALAYALFSTALVFVGRILAFWFLMIISPFAFISTTFPKGNKFQWWLDMLLNQAFVAPIFLFALYLIIQMIHSGVLDKISSSATGNSKFTSSIIIPILIATLLVVAIMKAKDLAKSLSGEFGQLGAKIGAGALGVGLGGTALLARKSIGGVAARQLRKGAKTEEELAGMSEGERKKYEKGRSRYQSLTKASFDVRNIGGKDSIFGATVGGYLGKGVGSLGVGKGTGVGGVEKKAKDQAQKDLAGAKNKEVGVFEEQGLREQAEKQKKTNDDNLKATEGVLTTATTDLAAALKASTDAQKAHDESEAARLEKEAGAAHEDALQRYERDKGTEHEASSLKAMTDTKTALDTAKSTHATSETGLAATAMGDVYKKAQAAEEDAKVAVIKARAEAKKTAAELSKEAISAENKRRRESYADKVAKGGWFTRGRLENADKIRGGDKPGAKSIEDMIKEQVKKETEAKPETGTGGGH